MRSTVLPTLLLASVAVASIGPVATSVLLTSLFVGLAGLLVGA